MEIIALILTVIYLVWLARIINFGIRTATRIAIATETSAANLNYMVAAMSEDAHARVTQVRMAEAVKMAQTPPPPEVKKASAGLGVALVCAVGIAFVLLMYFFYMTSSHAAERFPATYREQGCVTLLETMSTAKGPITREQCQKLRSKMKIGSDEKLAIYDCAIASAMTYNAARGRPELEKLEPNPAKVLMLSCAMLIRRDMNTPIKEEDR